MVKIYKTKNNLNFPVMNFMFERRNNTYNLRHFRVYDEKKKNCENESWNFKLQISAIMVNFAWKRNTN